MRLVWTCSVKPISWRDMRRRIGIDNSPATIKAAQKRLASLRGDMFRSSGAYELGGRRCDGGRRCICRGIKCANTRPATELLPDLVEFVERAETQRAGDGRTGAATTDG